MMLATLRRLASAVPLLALAVSAAMAQDYVPGELLVRWKPGIKAAARTDAMTALGVSMLARYDFISVERLSVPGMAVEEAVARLALDPRVEYAEPNYLVSIERAPDDERYPEQYSMHNTGQTGGFAGADISAEGAWDLFTGDPDLLIGDIDTGVDYDHPDLVANIWTNPGEIPGNGIDDDHNGYVDDVHGYDFFSHDGDPRDDNGHGTHTAGTICAVGNNGIGVAGVVWRAKLVAIKFLGASGFGPTSGAVEAIQYAIRVGVRLTNNSWTGGFYSRALEDAVIASGEAGQLLVAAAGNARSNIDLAPSYPAAFTEDNVVSVAATDQGDQLASYSNYGAESVDLAAPGSDILSTFPGGGYRLLSGTSMATPHVTGAAAFLMGRFPGMSAAVVKARLLQFATPLPGLAGRCVSGGRLQLALSASEADSLAPGALTDFAIVSPGSNTVDLAWSATGDDSTAGTASRYELRYATTPLDSATFGAATRAATPHPGVSGSAERVRVRGLASETGYWFAVRALDEFGNAGPITGTLAATTLPPPHVTLGPTDVTARGATGDLVLRDVELANDSPGTLDWTAPTAQLEMAGAQAVWPAEVAAKGAEPPAGGPQTEATGGPDAFGYRWSDSSEPGGPAFQWADVVAPGNAIALSGDEALSAPVDLGFSFPYYGRRFTRVRVCSNGYLQFGNESPVFVNSRLPSSGGPRNLIAPFWDDLDLHTGADKVFVHDDGTRWVVTWSEVQRYNDAGSVLTYQCVLYPSGEIRFQYLHATGNTSSATLGLQDSTRTVGLMVAFNQAYVRDSLAVRIVPLPQWLSVVPASGFLAPGARQTVQLRCDPAGLGSGTYRGRARFLTNDPAAPDTGVTVAFTVDGAPDLLLSPTALEFGSHFTGLRDTLPVTVANAGVDPLVVSRVTLTGAAFHGPTSPFTLLPGDATTFAIEFAPTEIADHRGSLEFASNDPDRPLAVLPLHGVGSASPVIELAATSLRAAAAPALRADAALRERGLVLRNVGGAPLEWSATTYQGSVGLAPQALVVPGPAVAQVKGGVGPGAAALGNGGPDAFGYRYLDSDARGGPTFEWTELATVGTRLFGGADDSTARVRLPFPFSFYGSTYDSVSVCTNGWLSFTSRESSLVNTDLPNASPGVPRSLVAPLWADFDFRSVRGSGRIYSYYDGSRFVVEWKDAVHFSGASPYTFQAILWPSGVIEFQYLAIGPLKNIGTVGIQDETGGVGLRVAYNTAYTHPGLCVRFSHQDDWLKLDRAAGTLAPGTSDSLHVTFDARDYKDGDYAGEVRFTSNDVEQPLLVMPCELHVGVHEEVTEAQPAAIGVVSQAPLVRLALSPPVPGATLVPGSLRVNGVPVRATGDVSHEPDGGLTVAFRAFDLLGVLPAADSLAVTLTGEYDPGGWFATRTTLWVTPPSLAGGPLPPFGATQPPRAYRGNEAVSVQWSVPEGGADGYEVAYSGDGGLRWGTVAHGTVPRVTFIPPDTTSSALVEVVARRGDGVVGTWLSNPFIVEPEVVAVTGGTPTRFALTLAGASPARGRLRLTLDQPVPGEARVEIYDVRGARVRTLVRGVVAPGRYPLSWDGRSDAGSPAAPGLYLVRARAGGASSTLRAVFLR